YHWTTNLFIDRLTEIYLWSMNPKDLDRVPKEGWIGFLEGGNPGFPETALRADFQHIRTMIARMRDDPTTADTRLADWPMGMNPATTQTLVNLMLGGYLAGNIWTLHSRVRYFDPVHRRSGAPEDVAALVEKLAADSITLTLVNTNQVDARTVIVQAGAYAEHQFNSVAFNGKTVAVAHPFITARLEPGCGTRMVFAMKRYANQPTVAQPWDRVWMVKR